MRVFRHSAVFLGHVHQGSVCKHPEMSFYSEGVIGVCTAAVLVGAACVAKSLLRRE